MKYILNIFILFIFISIFFQEISNQYIKMHFPLKLENIKILYKSKFIINYGYKIIVDYSNEILFFDYKDGNIKKINYEGFQFSLFNYYPNIETVINWNIIPQDYRISSDGLNYYFTKYSSLYLYNYYDTPKWGHYSYKRFFPNLENDNVDKCDLELAFNEYGNDEIAVYNLNNNKISVINLHDEIHNEKGTHEIIVTMDAWIAQSLIYRDEEGTKLIGIDLDGTIKFWGLHGLIFDYWDINTFKFKKPVNYWFRTAGIMKDNREKLLLYINVNDFILFDLKKIEIINEQPDLIPEVSTLLILDNGQGLVGTREGFIYLIELFNNTIIILDKYELCKGKIILNISYNTTCPRGHEMCYIFAANCGYENGYLKIFKIQNIKNRDSNL